MRFFLLIAFFTFELFASMRFYPSVIYATPEHNFKNVYIENISPKENIYKFSFGYTSQDIEGGFVNIPLDELDPKKDRSYCENIKVFPKRIKLKSGERQVVRLSFKNYDKAKFTEGEYYCRLYARGMPAVTSLDTSDQNVRAQINTVISVGAPIHFLTDKRKLDLDVKVFGHLIKNGTLFYKVKLINKTTVGFRGHFGIKVFDSSGKEVAKGDAGFAFQMNEILLYPKVNISELPSGDYSAEIMLKDAPTTEPGFRQFSSPLLIKKFNFSL